MAHGRHGQRRRPPAQSGKAARTPPAGGAYKRGEKNRHIAIAVSLSYPAACKIMSVRSYAPRGQTQVARMVGGTHQGQAARGYRGAHGRTGKTA